MSWLRRAVDKGVSRAVEDFCSPGGGLAGVVESVMWAHLEKSLSRSAPLTPLGFVWALRLCFRKHGSSYDEASDLANSTLAEFLADEKIEFGNPAYAWTREGAEAIAEEYELRHWEAA